MVQTEQQYICIHQCLLAVLDGKENDIPSPREIHGNDGFEGNVIEEIVRNCNIRITKIRNNKLTLFSYKYVDDEGIAESGM